MAAPYLIKPEKPIKDMERRQVHIKSMGDPLRNAVMNIFKRFIGLLRPV